MKLTFAHLRSHKWSLVLVLLLGFYLLLMLTYDLWNFGGVSRMRPRFADTHIVLAAAECDQKGYDVYLENPCDDDNRPHCYSRLWFFLGYTGLNTLHTDIVGGIVIAVFLSVCIIIIRPQDLTEFLILSILLFSPSIMLGVERANMDLLMFSLLVLCGYLLFSKIRLLRYLVYPILFLAAFLKFYPISSFAIFIYHFKKRRNFWLLTVLVVIIFGLFLWVIREDFSHLNNNIPRPNGWFSFGLSALMGTITKGKMAAGANLIVAIVILLSGYGLSLKTQLNEQASSPLNTIFFLLGSWNIIFCFFLNTNYDYRTIFYILLIPYLYDVLRSKDTLLWTGRMILIFFSALAISLWFNFFRYAIEFTGTNFGRPDLAENLTWAFFILKQIGSWITISILITINIELIKKPLQHQLWGLDIFQPFKKLAKTDQTRS